jgi:succinyl-CoA synthetase beta subunit
MAQPQAPDQELQLSEHDSREIVQRCGVPLNRWRLARDEDFAVLAAQEIGFPVAIKTASPSIVHKSDSGCVALNIESDEAVRTAYRNVTTSAEHASAIDASAVTIQEMASGEVELFVGIHWSEIFGHTLAIGLGGIWVELLEDVSLRLCPISREDVIDMLSELRANPLLHGFRGRPAVDIESFVELAVAASHCPEHDPRLLSLDLNPVLVKAEGSGAVAVDASITVRPGV